MKNSLSSSLGELRELCSNASVSELALTGFLAFSISRVVASHRVEMKRQAKGRKGPFRVRHGQKEVQSDDLAPSDFENLKCPGHVPAGGVRPILGERGAAID